LREGFLPRAELKRLLNRARERREPWPALESRAAGGNDNWGGPYPEGGKGGDGQYYTPSHPQEKKKKKKKSHPTQRGTEEKKAAG